MGGGVRRVRGFGLRARANRVRAGGGGERGGHEITRLCCT
jgi:hypothetical protein